MHRENHSSDYDVGYGKPPLEHRFKPGQSGNPKGRPSRAKRASGQLMRDLLIEMSNEILPVTIAGTRRYMTKKQAILMALFNDALAGTPTQRIKAFESLMRGGAFDVNPTDHAPTAEARRKFLQALAEEYRREQEEGRD
jgi:Family of unknown function (DUF5681)